MKKRVRSLLVIMVMLAGCLGLSACSGDTKTAEAPTTEAVEETTVAEEAAPEEGEASEKETDTEKTLNFVYFISHMENEFQSQLVAAVTESAEEKGINLTVISADKDPAKQVSQIENAVAAGNIDGALLQATSADGVTAGVQALKEAGVPTITLHEAITAQEEVTSYVGPDLPTIGLIVMEHVCEELNGKGDIAILVGVMGNSVQVSIAESYDKILAEYPDINVVFRDTANWETDEALAKVENWLSTGKHIDTIVCMNDSMAIGAMQAVNSAGETGNIKIYGSDAVEQAVAAVKNKEMTGTVYFDVTEEGKAAIDTLYDAANGVEVEKEVLMPPALVIEDNINELFPD